MTKITDIPAIRFKGFSDTWEQRKLTEFVEFFSGLTYTPNDVQENGTLVLRSSNVSNGEVVDADNIYVNPQVVNSENVKVGDIVVVVRNGSRSLIGKHAQIKAFMPNTVIGAFMTGIRSECPEFTNALLNTSRFEEEIAMNMGATINQITGYMFSKMEFKMPCLDEQKKIGEYFEKLDNLITLHQRKYDKLTNVKKSMLEKMFPQNGSNAPEIRFKGFTEAWEQRKLGDVVDVRSGKDYKHLSEGNIPVYGTGGFMLSVNQALSYDEDAIGIGRKGTIDKPYILKAPFWTVDTLFYAIPREKVDLNFAFDVFQNIDWKKKDESTGVPSLSKTAINEIDVLVPQYDEQQPLGQFFNRIDNLITLHQCKCQIDGCRFQSPLAITWEQRKLSEIATMHARIGWQNLRTSEFLDSGDYMLITGTDFIDGAVNFDTCHYVERERYEQDKHIQIRNGSILITKDGTLGKVAYIQGLTMPATLNAGVFNVEIKDENEVDNRYLFQYLKAPFLMDYVDKKATGGTIKHLNQNILVDFPVVLPHKAEQEKIGEYFLAIDHLITLHQCE